jgi:hypothetical protein
VNITSHVTTHNRYDAQAHCLRVAAQFRKMANRTMDATAAERYRLDMQAWLELADLARFAQIGV